jgi:hypothetical protein
MSVYVTHYRPTFLQVRVGTVSNHMGSGTVEIVRTLTMAMVIICGGLIIRGLCLFRGSESVSDQSPFGWYCWNCKRTLVALSLQPWRWRQYVPPKCRYLPTSPHGDTTQDTNIDIFTAATTWNLISWEKMDMNFTRVSQMKTVKLR